MKRVLPILLVFLIGVVAFASAFGVNTAIRLAIAVPSDVVIEVPTGEVESSGGGSSVSMTEASGSGPASPLGLTRKQYVDAILKRNIFDAAAIGRESATGQAAAAITALSVRLIATMVAEPASFSSALIAEEGRENSAKGYGIGDKLQDAEVIAIESRKVTLKRADGNLEYLTMDDQTPTLGNAVAAAAPVAGAEAVDGITQLGENHYQVERRILEQYLGNLEGLSSMARAIPHKGADGEIDGYRLSGIRRNSPLSQLGIKNGDVIQSVNGTNIGNMGEAMTVFNSLSSQSHFTFDVTRRGQKQAMEYDVK